MKMNQLKVSQSGINCRINEILVIEDEKTLREEILDILRFEGFEVLEAVNGKEGLEIALCKLPDLILCDIMMPEMDGNEVLKNLMKSERTRHIPFIFITALSERTDIRSGMDSGADDYLVKPFTVDELLGSIYSRIRKAADIDKQIKVNVIKAQNEQSQKILKLKDKITEQNNDIDLLRLEKFNNVKNKTEYDTLIDTMQSIESDNKFQNLEKIVNRELLNTKSPENTEKFFIDLYNEIRKQSTLTNTWSIFQFKFRQLFPPFFENLNNSFPHLKQSEIALAAAIAMNLSTLQIAYLQNITAASVRKNKYRLKKKFKLSREENLAGFILTISYK